MNLIDWPSLPSDAAAALAGVRVPDLSRVLSGPYCTRILADHGAAILKLEPPGGDQTRTWGPHCGRSIVPI